MNNEEKESLICYYEREIENLKVRITALADKLNLANEWGIKNYEDYRRAVNIIAQQDRIIKELKEAKE